ncbi:MAG TPA: CBS domain-containing protein [Candidatus Binataceae bacterium]|nr:CBS domain-containing protein [Candidatus Binataceae bacterium]
MTSDVKWCGIHDSLNSAARIMWDNDCGCVPIVDDEARVVGVLTDRDICMAAYTQGLPLFAIPVETAMSRDVIACSPAASVETAHRLMRINEVHRLLVADDSGRLAGILSFSDLANGRGIDGDAAQAEAAVANEIAATIAKIRKSRKSAAEAAKSAARPHSAAHPAESAATPKKRAVRRKPTPKPA